ncbi:MAG: bifunctional proline dehydrogenase/L-glutamate gamma-semialdehyde dehydrogenase [Bacteroidaceae bacterium]|nr:bifunctional proline dehydrogenase/L-glutamate gamma-semialdehyde dehydrogenase [Bacteroidaceae bacterium]
MKEQQLPTIEEVFSWMRKLYDESYSGLTKLEKSEQHMYGTMVTTPSDKKFIVRMLDETSQIRDRQKLAIRVKELIDQYGIPKFLDCFDHALFWMYQKFAYLPLFNWVAVPIIKWRLRRDTSRVIIDAARPSLTEHLATRFHQDIGQNVNLLGEVVLGDGEADKRYRSYLEALKEPDINYISVKISGIYAQTHALNYKECFPELVRRMSELYQTAIDYPYTDVNGVAKPKFINLDMEEYKDAHLTMKLFKDVLSLPQFKNYEAGIVVQAYLPDAEGFQSELLEFARKRVAEGGSPIKMRIVKGCNLDMENIVSDLRGWPNPVRPNKTEVDANYLHIIERGLKPENARVLHIGMASHNLFTISYAYLLSEMYQTPKDCFCFEMLEGMANHVWRAQKKLGNHVILYTPVVKKEHFLNAISYLVRRMDENTAPDNFLTHSFSLKPDTREWNDLQQQFINAYNMKDNLNHTPTRTQDRNQPYMGQEPKDEMQNEPDTDFDRFCNQQWVEKIFAKWKCKGNMSGEKSEWGDWKPGDLLPTQIGDELTYNDDHVKYFDRSQDGDMLVCEMSRAGKEQVQQILNIADADAGKWRDTTVEERHRIMYRAANILGQIRGDLNGSMCAITGKTIEEADIEVSEAIDYCRFYTTTMKKFAALPDIEMRGKGTVLVLSPWNFPCAIPCGGVVAALASGNTCILKPATVAAPVAWLFAKAFWEAGVPKQALQVIIADREATPLLTSSPVIKHVILTGGTETSQTLAHNNPRKPLSAETGGKNVMIISAKSDRDHAIMNACRSAFGNAGQKCSACSLLLVERSVYTHPEFFEKLKDCASSLKVGGVWNAGNIVGPMITNYNEKLEQAFKLEPGERWLIAPEFVDEKHYILRPTIKVDVKPESFTFRTELFAPLLAVAPYDTLEQAVDLVNGLDYGLTSGLQSLDEQEQRFWKNHVLAGNLYINRGITGAIVNRQPFGGMKLSAFGPGLKAGGPNYVAQFMTIADKAGTATDFRTSYAEWYEREFRHPRNIQPKIRGEQNVFRYLPLTEGGMVLRLFGDETKEQVEMVCLAAQTVGTPLTVSADDGNALLDAARTFGAKTVNENLAAFCESIKKYERIRTISTEVPDIVFQAAANYDKYIAQALPVHDGRIELIHYIKEQSISNEYHRYGSQIEVPVIE